MPQPTNADARTRIALFNELEHRHRKEEERDRFKVTPYSILKRGFLPPEYENEAKALQPLVATQDNSPLSLNEQLSYATYFFLHPEKVCGKEEIVTSAAFPIKIKATKEDVHNTIYTSLKRIRRMRIARAKLALYAYAQSEV